MKVGTFRRPRRRLASLEQARDAVGDRPEATADEEIEGVLGIHQHDDSPSALGGQYEVRVEVERLALMVDGRDVVARADEPAHSVRGVRLGRLDSRPVELLDAGR
jgi:hypothetical protein